MPTVTFDVSIEESHSVLKKVLPLMSQQQVPTIPQNYAVWYDFVCQANPDLVTELEQRMARGLRFSPDACQQLFEKYFLQELRAQVGEIQSVMRRTVDATLDELHGMDRSLHGFGAVLARASALLAELPAPEVLAALVTELGDETRTTQARSAAAGNTIRAMRTELEALRVQVDALARDSRQDSLTGVANRRALDDGLRRMLAEVAESDEELCLLFVDVDGFAAFNDSHGRPVADQALRYLAQELDQCVKGRDLLARYDGATFAILLPATSYNGAMMLAESIRAIIEAQVVETDSGLDIDELTVSLGVAQCRPDDTEQTLIARSDACLRQSKATGRNRVTGERDLRG
ncbi:MAG: GGDEF domain-containing protein [Pseudomonadales bacterium]